MNQLVGKRRRLITHPLSSLVLAPRRVRLCQTELMVHDGDNLAIRRRLNPEFKWRIYPAV